MAKKHKKTHCVHTSSKKGSKKIACFPTKAKAKAAAKRRRAKGLKAAVKTRARKK